MQQPAALRPEIELAILCARTRPTAAQQARIRALAADAAFNWAFCWGWVREHAVAALVAQTLSETLDAGAIPPAWLTIMRSDQHRQLLNNVALLNTTLAIVQAAAERGIAIVPYKGVVTSWLLYGQVGLRHAGDIDLLVRPEDVLAARQLINEQTPYKETSLALTLSPAAAQLYLREFTELKFDHVSEPRMIELQWGLARSYMPPPPADCAPLATLRDVALGDATIKQPPAETLLLMLAVHASKHLWNRLFWLCDINQLLATNPDLDWERVWQMAQAWRCQRIVALTLALVELTFERSVPIPPPLRAAVQRATRQRYALLCDPQPPPHARKWKRFLALWPLGDRPADRLRLTRLLLDVQDPDLTFLRLPDRLVWLYPLLRPIRLGLVASGLRARRPAGRRAAVVER